MLRDVDCAGAGVEREMRIAYTTEWYNASREDGILKKIIGQMQAWSSQDCEVKLFLFTPSDQVWEGLNKVPVDVVRSRRIRTHVFRTRLVVKHVLAWKPDIVYLRFSMYYPPLERLMGCVPTVVEVNTDDVGEYRMLFNRYIYLYHRLTRSRVFRKVRGILTPTHELGDRFGRYNKPLLVVSNGIEIAQYAQFPAPNNLTPRLVFIGTPRHWHGVDKVLWLAGHFPDWRFDLIGVEPESLRDAPANLLAHGMLHRKQYEGIMAQADVAIGTLALHRNGMNEASPLKVREYLAYGIPTIIGYQDTDFPKPVPYLLRLPNTPDNVMRSSVEIARFVEASRGTRVPRTEIGHLDRRTKERNKVSFFHQILGEEMIR